MSVRTVVYIENGWKTLQKKVPIFLFCRERQCVCANARECRGGWLQTVRVLYAEESISHLSLKQTLSIPIRTMSFIKDSQPRPPPHRRYIYIHLYYTPPTAMLRVYIYIYIYICIHRVRTRNAGLSKCVRCPRRSYITCSSSAASGL